MRVTVLTRIALSVAFTLQHILYGCEWIIAEHGPVPAVWWPFVEQRHFWLRGLVPMHWTQQALPEEEIQVTGAFTRPEVDGDNY